MDERELSDPIVREGDSAEKAPEASPKGITADDLFHWSQEWNDDETLFLEMQQRESEEQISEATPLEALPSLDNGSVSVPSVPEAEQEENVPKAPSLWMEPYSLQQEEVKEQETQMRDVVELMLSTSDLTVERNAVSDIALLRTDEISRMDDLALDDVHERGFEIGMGDE